MGVITVISSQSFQTLVHAVLSLESFERHFRLSVKHKQLIIAIPSNILTPWYTC